MMQGDQYRIPIELTTADGEVLTADTVKDVEVCVGHIRKTLSEGGLQFDETDKLFNVFITQKESFTLNGSAKVQARILFASGDVYGLDLGHLNVRQSTSKVVLK